MSQKGTTKENRKGVMKVLESQYCWSLQVSGPLMVAMLARSMKLEAVNLLRTPMERQMVPLFVFYLEVDLESDFGGTSALRFGVELVQ